MRFAGAPRRRPATGQDRGNDEAVWFRYSRGGAWTLRAVDVSVQPGQTVVVLGANGAGKSTLLQLAAGVLTPVRGAVRDRPRVVGWVPERFPADQPFTTRQYLARMAEIRGLRDRARVDAWIERLLLTEHTGTRLADLSKGTAQKVGLAQALLDPPGLLVLDEPWEGLDAVARTLIPQIVAEVTEAGGMVLVSDHRGEITGLPDAIHWTVENAEVRETARPEPAEPDEVHETARPNEVHETVGPDEVHETPGPDEVHVVAEPERPDEVIVEVAVRRADADQAVVRLRAAGHRVLAVRDPAATHPHQGRR